MEHTDEPREDLKSFEWRAVQGTPEIYGNYVHIGWTIDDVRITLGLLKSANVSSDNHYAEEKGSLLLSYRQAKNLSENLARLILAYEDKNQKISVPFLPEVR